ncbi:MAG: DUF2975 domain-containing protein [Proteobacteria bacterium]|nr:DUF2975 domain-containing protein [Pseudomonadota bacterium]
MNKIQSISHKMQILFETLLILAPVATIAYWTFYEFFAQVGINWFSYEFYHQTITVNYKSKILAMIVTFIPTSVIMYGIIRLKKLFFNYSNNLFFTHENVVIYRQLGKALFALVIADILIIPLLSFALSYQNPVGSRFISVAIGSSEIITLIIGFIVMTVSYVMNEAYKLELEAQHTV